MTAKTKTKILTFAERVTASREELTSAEAERVATSAALADALDAVTQIERTRLHGDRSQPAEDVVAALSAAHMRVTVCRMDDEGAEARVKRARRDLVNDDTTIAGALAAALRDLDLFPGHEIVATAEAPEGVPASVEKPRLYVVQSEAPTRDLISGRVSGLVTLCLHRPDWGVRLDVDDLPDALATAQIYADTHTVLTHGAGGMREDETQISVRGVWPHLPVIKRLNGEHRFGQILAGLVADHAGRGYKGDPRGTAYDGLSSTGARSRAVAAQGESRVLNVIESSGERRTTVEAILTLRSSVVGGAQIVDSVTEYVGSMMDTCAEGLGRVVAVERVKGGAEDPAKRDAPLRIRAGFTFLSATA